jgi:hypothetical protein
MEEIPVMMMMTCHEVALLVATGDIDRASPSRRLQVRLHVLICSSCRIFRRQLASLRRAARSMRDQFDTEYAAAGDLDLRIARRLGSDDARR